MKQHRRSTRLHQLAQKACLDYNWDQDHGTGANDRSTPVKVHSYYGTADYDATPVPASLLPRFFPTHFRIPTKELSVNRLLTRSLKFVKLASRLLPIDIGDEAIIENYLTRSRAGKEEPRRIRFGEEASEND